MLTHILKKKEENNVFQCFITILFLHIYIQVENKHKKRYKSYKMIITIVRKKRLTMNSAKGLTEATFIVNLKEKKLIYKGIVLE